MTIWDATKKAAREAVVEFFRPVAWIFRRICR